MERDSYFETSKKVYGKDHRIVVYHSSKLERKNIISFMRRFSDVYMKVRKIVDSGDSDSMEKARLYLEAEKLDETILLPSLAINIERMHDRISVSGKTHCSPTYMT
ncbi:MAG TPA: hypothetical protein VKU79_04370 [Thermoplasmataceae archaeon]|nr:hypothetical protein [Thermoplasmataceae archaeon]